MPRRSALAATAALAAAALALTACTGDGGTPSGSGGGVDDAASLTVGLVLEPSNLDIRHTDGAALDQALIDNVYEGLVSRDAENNIVPRLASEWEVSEDGLTYTFTLEEGVTFHDGSPLTSADVLDSFTDAKTDATIKGNAELAIVSTITAPDASTVVVTLTEPDINFLFTLTGRAGLVLKADESVDLKTAANGTGPFTVDTWAQGTSLTLARYEDYWGTPAGVAEAVLTYIPDFTAGVNAALDGSLDVLTAVDSNLAPQLEGTDFTLTSGKTTDKGTLAFNQSTAPLDDIKVREALRLAIDRDALIEALGGTGQPMYGPIPELDPGFEDLSDVVSYDTDRAKELLAEAGAEDLKLTLTLPSFYGTTVPTFLVSAYDAIGVELKVQQVEFAAWLDSVYTKKDFELSFVLHVEARDFGNWANPEYYFTFDDATVQDLYDRALATVDQEESEELLAEAARIVSEAHAADWLYNGQTITAVGPGISDFPLNSINSRLPLAGVSVAAE